MIALVLAVVLIAANGFFVAAEFAFAKVRPTALEALARQGDARAQRAHRMLGKLDGYLAVCQLGITLASLGLGWVGEPALADLIAPPLHDLGASDTVVHGIAYTVAFVLISILHITVGEQVPKMYAIQNPEFVSRRSGALLRLFFFLTWPAMWLLNGMSNAMLRLIRVPAMGHADGKMSAEEMRSLIRASFGEADGRDRKRDLLERVLRGTDRPVRAVMVPRVDMVSVSIDDSPAEVMTLVRRHGYSRYPICEDGDPDKVVGYVHIKDVLTAEHLDRPLSSMKRDILFVPESTVVGGLLSEFQMTSIPIAIVVDEYGGTDGLVTVEDVVEEVVGEIQDEHDEERPKVVTREDGSVVVDATVPLDELELEGLVGGDQIAESVGGYVVEQLGRLARPGDRVRAGSWDIVVEDVRRRRVARAALVRRPESVHPADDEDEP